MKLNHAELKNRAQWEEKGYHLPEYDRKAVAAATKENPFWIHFGAGNIFRAFQANAVQYPRIRWHQLCLYRYRKGRAAPCRQQDVLIHFAIRC